MALTTNTNVASLNAQRNITKTQSSLNKALARLSSGLRINSAKDDAAGLAISNRMTAKIRGFNQAIRNANDGISMAQVAEGAMDEATNLLQRMRELAVQAANGSNSAEDRVALQKEMDQLYSELDRIASSTEFNGKKLLDGTARSMIFQIGADAGQTLSFGIGSIKSQSLNLNGYSKLGDLNGGRVGAEVATTTLFDGTNAGEIEAGEVLINGKNWSGATATLAGADDAAAIAAAINSNTGQHGVQATAYNVIEGNAVADDGTVKSITVDGTTVQATTQGDLVEKINRDMAGVTAMLNSDNSITLSNETGNDIDITASTGTGLSIDTYTGYVSLSSLSGEAIAISSGTTEATSHKELGLKAILAMGFTPTAGGSQQAEGQAVSTTKITASSDLQINAVQVGASASASAADKAASINAIKDQTGVEARAYTEVTLVFNADVLGTAANAQAINLNGTDVDLSVATTLTDVVDAINTAVSGISASVTEDGLLKLRSETGNDIVVLDNDAAGTGSDDYLGAMYDQTGEELVNDVSTAETAKGSIALTSTTGADIRVTGSDADIIGYTATGGSQAAVGTGLDVSNVRNANNAINRLDEAISKISEYRSVLGAVQNRFESTISNLANVSENLSNARSRIIDADFAAETAEMTRSQIMMQSGIAMLSQSNQLPQMVLSLLQ